MISVAWHKEKETKGLFGGRVQLLKMDPKRGAPSMTRSYATPTLVAPPSFTRARKHAAETEQRLLSCEMIGAAHSEVEAFVNESCREWARLLFEEHRSEERRGGKECRS